VELSAVEVLGVAELELEEVVAEVLEVAECLLLDFRLNHCHFDYLGRLDYLDRLGFRDVPIPHSLTHKRYQSL